MKAYKVISFGAAMRKVLENRVKLCCGKTIREEDMPLALLANRNDAPPHGSIVLYDGPGELIRPHLLI